MAENNTSSTNTEKADNTPQLTHGQYNIQRIITDLGLAAFSLPLLAGGIRGLYTFSRLPIPTQLEKRRSILNDIEYRLIKYNPDLFTRTQIKLIGEEKKRQIIEKIKQIKEEEEAKRKGKKEQEEKQKEEDEEKSNENEDTKSIIDAITKQGIQKGNTANIFSVKRADAATDKAQEEYDPSETFGRPFGIFKALVTLLLSNPIYPAALVGVPGLAYLIGNSVADKINSRTAEKYTKSYLNAAKSRFYNDLLDLQLFTKKKTEGAFTYENLLALPLSTRKKLRDILLENTGRDYGPYLGLDIKYPALLPDKAILAEESSKYLSDKSEKNSKKNLDFLKGMEKEGSARDLFATVFGTAVLFALSYPILNFTAKALTTFMHTKAKDPLKTFKNYLEQRQDVVYIPEESVPKKLEGLSQAISEIVHPEDLLVGILTEKGKGIAKRKEQEKRKKKEPEPNQTENTPSSSEKESFSAAPVELLIDQKFRAIRNVY